MSEPSSSSASTSPQTPLACLVLAAGKGTRMRSARSKVLHEILGAPLVSYPIRRAQELGATPIVAVLGHQRSEVEATLVRQHGAGAITVVEQVEQRGTGQAVALGLAPLAAFEGTVLILYGDVPLLRAETLRGLVAAAQAGGGKLGVLTFRAADPSGYGRVVRDASGAVRQIVEDKDASAAERAITEVNGGIYAAPADFLRRATAGLSPKNAQGEYYLTDIVAAAADSIGVTALLTDEEELAGINDRRQLAAAQATLRDRINGRWLEHATFEDPGSAFIEESVLIDADVVIGRGVSLRGRTHVGAGARIGDGVILTNVTVGADTEIKPYSVAEDARIGERCKVGPFAHLRPGTELGDEVHIGNFVETKKTRLGKGSKANHLTYLGDAVIGRKVNVGAGTITCNYNGYEKRQTVIDDGAFIGSDTQLVAPVRVGARAVIAAGTTVTRDVPDGALAISRAEQKHHEGYADRVADRYRTVGETLAVSPGGRISKT